MDRRSFTDKTAYQLATIAILGMKAITGFVTIRRNI